MYYYNSLNDDNGYIYSCDNIRLEFQLSSCSELMIKVSQFLCSHCDNYYTSLKAFTYKYCFNFKLDLDISFTVLVGFNTFSRLQSLFVIDFNPNKCMHFQKFKDIVSYLFFICNNFNGFNMLNDVIIKRYDVAVDIPYKRSNVSVFWNGRGAKKHESIQTTVDDLTEYFGERNSPGRIKIYNKTLEDVKKKSVEERLKYKNNQLDFYTRIEVTHNTLDSQILFSSFPTVFSNYDTSIIPNDIKPVDYILIMACRSNSNYLRLLKTTNNGANSGGKWNKLKKYIIPEVIEFDLNVLSDVLFNITTYCDVSTYTLDFEQVLENIDRMALNSFDYSFDDYDSVCLESPIGSVDDDGFEVVEPMF